MSVARKLVCLSWVALVATTVLCAPAQASAVRAAAARSSDTPSMTMGFLDNIFRTTFDALKKKKKKKSKAPAVPPQKMPKKDPVLKGMYGYTRSTTLVGRLIAAQPALPGAWHPTPVGVVHFTGVVLPVWTLVVVKKHVVKACANHRNGPKLALYTVRTGKIGGKQAALTKAAWGEYRQMLRHPRTVKSSGATGYGCFKR